MAPDTDQHRTADPEGNATDAPSPTASNEGRRPFGVTLISVAIGFWGLLYAAVGISEPTMAGTLVAGMGIGAILIGAGLFVRHPLAHRSAVLALLLATVWYSLGIVQGRIGAPFGAIGSIVGVLYLRQTLRSTGDDGDPILG